MTCCLASWKRSALVACLPLLLWAAADLARAASIVRAPHEMPEVVLLTAPAWIQAGRPVDVAVTAAYVRGIGAIEIRFNDEFRRLPVRNERTASVVTRFDTRGNGFNRLSVVAISTDGLRGPPREQTILAGDDRRIGPERDPQEYRDMLADVGYPERAGSLQNLGREAATLGDGIPWWYHWFESFGPKAFDWQHKCVPAVQSVDVDGRVLECWLALHPNVAKSILWTEYDGTTIHDFPLAQWTDDMRKQLHVAFFYAWQWMHGELGTFNGAVLPSVPTNQLSLQDHEPPFTRINRDDAWNLYVGTIAHSLAVEIGGFVSWSVVNYNDNDLSILFNANEMFFIGTTAWTYDSVQRSASGYILNDSVPAPPTENFLFLVTQDIIRPDPFRTVGHYLLWGRDNVCHTASMPTPSGGIDDGRDAISAQAFWDYRGVAPASRVLASTMVHDPFPPFAPLWPNNCSWVYGCHGMSFFTKELLRAVNIPVFTSTGNIGKTLHTTPFFRTLGYTMSHGDDMYDRANQATPVFPGEWLLITNQNFDYWFNGPGQLGPNGSSNVGRQADYDVPIKSLSDDLVQRYCADKQSNATHDNGTVAAFFYDNVYGVTIYTVQQLEGMNLWDQLGTKAAAMGLCTP